MNFIKNNTLYYSFNSKPTSKIAGFDLDNTLIKTKSGEDFSKDEFDWEFNYPNVIDILNNYYTNGYQIVIFTNQKGISKGKTDVQVLFSKLNKIQKALNIPLDILIASEDDYYRKPLTGMWDFIVENHILKTPELFNNSFFCGDAAGRIYDKKNKDFSISDMYFANNIGIKFMIPEEVFDQPIKNFTREIDYNPMDFLNKNQLTIEKSNKQEMILLVGRPASGKSTFAKQYYNDYIYINQDTEKTKAKCINKAKDAINKKQNVIIDNTNGTIETRKEYINLVDNDVVIKIYIFDIPLLLNYHLNYYRVQQSKGMYKLIPQIVYNIYNKKYQEPSMNELIGKNGEIIKIKFIPNLKTDMDKKMFLYKFDI